MRRTKIICTLGPATDSAEIIRNLIKTGVDVFRLNMSHGTHEWVKAIVPRIRTAAIAQDRIVGILLDTQGPAIRTGDVATKLNLKPGDVIEFTVRGSRSEESFSVDVNYDGLVNDISVGDTVMVDNGVIHMKVLSKTENLVRCEVLTPGMLGSRRHINLPGVKVNLPPLTEKDMGDIGVGVAAGVDMVALSFCREASDVDELRRVLREHDSKARVVVKIEDQTAIKNLDEIILRTDAVMVARGDLGIECPMEELPIIQRRIVKHCLRAGRPVIVATHMLESMISNPVPTRAEVTDVANAVFEQADAIMLSGETSVGQYPTECVGVLDRVARRIEKSMPQGYLETVELPDDRKKTIRSAVVLANSIPGSHLVVFTRSGKMADYASNLRPTGVQIHAFAPTIEVCRKIALNWGTQPHLLALDPNPSRTIHAAERLLSEGGWVKNGDKLVIVSDLLAGEELIDSIQVRCIS
jgi:pyruvate kinase